MTFSMDLSALSSWGLQTSIAVSLLIALVLLIRKPFARQFGAKAAYMLWALPFARLVLPPLETPLGQFWGHAAMAPTIETHTPTHMITAPAMSAGLPEATAMLPVEGPAVTTVARSVERQASGFEWSALAALPWTSILLTVWALGFGFFLTRLILRQSQFIRLIGVESREASPALRALALETARHIGLRRMADVRTSLLCSGPLVTGAARPVILLPEWFEEDYTVDEQRQALTHELMHVKRGDLWALQAASIFRAAQWFNPLAHLGMNAFRTDQEAACDADVLRQKNAEPHTYGKTLVKAVRLAQPTPQMAGATGLTLNHAIKDRLLMMQRPAPTLKTRLTGGAAVLALGAATLALTASPSLAQGSDPDLVGGETKTQIEIDGSHDARTVHIHGKARMVLFDDPFEDTHTIHEQISAIEPPTFEFEFDALDLSELDALEELDFADIEIPAPPMPPVPVPEFQRIETANGVKIVIPRQEFEFSTESEAWEAYAEQWEQQAEAFSERMEAYTERTEAHAERIAERAEAQAERIAVRHQTRAEEMAVRHEREAERFEAEIERLVEGKLEPVLDDANDVIEDLDDACSDAKDDDLSPAVVSARSGRTGKVFQALCFDGSRQLNSAETAAFVDAHPDLSDSEKRAFRNRDRKD